MDRSVQIEDRPNGVRALTLSNLRKRNALDMVLLDELMAALRKPRADGTRVRALLLRGGGTGVFCSGYDIGTGGGRRQNDDIAGVGCS